MGALLDLLFPPRCAACDELLEEPGCFCPVCALASEPVPEPHCRTCAEPRVRGLSCTRCRRHPPPFSGTLAAFVHEGPVARAIHRLKYEDQPALAGPLGRALAEFARPARLAPGTRLVPVPLHRTRLRARRYDQAALLAGMVGRRLGVPVAWDALVRIRPTLRQVGLTDAEREANVQGAFRAPRQLQGAHLLLVDDVVTTGATARAAAAALRAAGAADVRVLVVARATDAP
ncbi:MAG TPA: ComF family protein [Myxococcaceae bacterium]|nr:ComF family protein [Myxococcaceae bacterium]